MILRNSYLRLRTLHTSTKALAAKASSSVSVPIPKTSVQSPFPPKARPAENDPKYKHPPSSTKAGDVLRNLQILKDQPEIVALPDDYYPDWLWQLLDDPQSVVDRENARQEIIEKKIYYVNQLKLEEQRKRLIESKKSRVVPAGVKRTDEEKQAVRREAQNEAWLQNREKEYEFPQFEMPPERSSSFHKAINKEKIKHENYLRGRGMK
jgi:hypothetical protein